MGSDVRSTVKYPAPTSAAATAVMKANRKRDTGPEVRLRSALHRAGLRFRKDFAITAGSLRVRADVVFPTPRVVVFSDGCFWHACPEHGTSPRANADYWEPKLARNVERDRAVDTALRDGGWTVVRIWEHEAPEDAAEAVLAVVGSIRRR
jgi:DNA mismatch endonuclease (patch repair protein)